MSSLKLIKKAHDVDCTNSTKYKTIVENLQYLSTNQKTSITQLVEGVTHVLAGLGQTAQFMHPNSVASFLAGVAKLSDELMSSDDVNKKQQSLKVLTAASMKYDELTKQALPNSAVVQIAQYGSKFPELVQQYIKLTTSVNSAEQVANAAQVLSSTIDQAMTAAKRARETLSSNPSASANVRVAGK
jgi:hypothetical protein